MFFMVLAAVLPAILLLAAMPSARAQETLPASPAPLISAAPVGVDASPRSVTNADSPAVEQLLSFRESDVKFRLDRLMDVLRDRRHEGWVLAAYPDPKTAQPLIGAGFSLDLPARVHLQRDPLNPHPFLEPSSADLWQAAGLEPARLRAILSEFHTRLDTWNKKKFRTRIRTLSPQITEEDATLLLRIGAIQAIYNARAYCRDFDRLTASQQMALSQLVYQMGVNLEEFTQFLGLINGVAPAADGGSSQPAEIAASSIPVSAGSAIRDPEYWSGVQQSLIHSQWARLYRARAVAVIAMLDPRYPDDPGVAERRVSATLMPAVVHRHRKGAGSREVASVRTHSSTPGRRLASHPRTKRRT
jgi:hypothetical protein